MVFTLPIAIPGLGQRSQNQRPSASRNDLLGGPKVHFWQAHGMQLSDMTFKRAQTQKGSLAPCTLRRAPSLRLPPCTLHLALCTLHLAPCTLRPAALLLAPNALHLVLRFLLLASGTSASKCLHMDHTEPAAQKAEKARRSCRGLQAGTSSTSNPIFFAHRPPIPSGLRAHLKKALRSDYADSAEGFARAAQDPQFVP